MLILVVLAVPAAKTLIKLEDSRGSTLSVKVTGYQWKWQYDYLDQGVSYFSTLSRDSNAARQLQSGIDPTTVNEYLRDVDYPLVVPTGAKVRLLLTSADPLSHLAPIRSPTVSGVPAEKANSLQCVWSSSSRKTKLDRWINICLTMDRHFGGRGRDGFRKQIRRFCLEAAARTTNASDCALYRQMAMAHMTSSIQKAQALYTEAKMRIRLLLPNRFQGSW